MQPHKFDVFGTLLLVQREGQLWDTFSIGPDGKRAPAGFVIPEFVLEDELEQYLFDLFHESATCNHGEIRRIE